MDASQRENLKKKIEADLQLLIAQSWQTDVIEKLKNILNQLEEVTLEGYDD